uniref:Uncharacterized protein n=1 Tax=Anas platyrhynchos platyrhynchos TaxID=8840 RepID=A0A493TQX4_ANAPP
AGTKILIARMEVMKLTALLRLAGQTSSDVKMGTTVWMALMKQTVTMLFSALDLANSSAKVENA